MWVPLAGSGLRISGLVLLIDLMVWPPVLVDPGSTPSPPLLFIDQLQQFQSLWLGQFGFVWQAGTGVVDPEE